MRTGSLIRSGVALTAIVGVFVGASAVGCSDDAVTPGSDAGRDTGGSPGTAGSPGTDSGGTPGGDGGDAGPTSAPPKLNFVHAAGNIPTVAFCMAIGNAGALSFALDSVFPTNDGGLTNGLPPGSGGPLSVPASSAAVIPTVAITAFAVPRSLVAAAPAADQNSCTKLIPTPNGALPTGVIKFPTIPAGTFAMNKSYVAAVIGCDPTAVDGTNAGRCNGADGGVIQPGLAVFEVNKATDPGAGNGGAQFLHLARGLESLPGTVGLDDAGAPVSGFPFSNGINAGLWKAPTEDGGGGGGDGGGGGNNKAIITPAAVKFAGVPATPGSPLTPPVAVTNLTDPLWRASFWTAAGTTGAPNFPPAAAAPAGDGQPGIPMNLVLLATFGTTPPAGYLANGKNYTMVALGDPRENAQDGGAARPYAFRVILLSNDP